jgi:hypothetical protein
MELGQKVIRYLVFVLFLSGCASTFDGPGYWRMSAREPVPNPAIKAGRLIPCAETNHAGCYDIGTKTIFIKTPAWNYACTERHERLHACGWDHPDQQPLSEADRCGWHIPLCK